MVLFIRIICLLLVCVIYYISKRRENSAFTKVDDVHACFLFVACVSKLNKIKLKIKRQRKKKRLKLLSSFLLNQQITHELYSYDLLHLSNLVFLMYIMYILVIYVYVYICIYNKMKCSCIYVFIMFVLIIMFVSLCL